MPVATTSSTFTFVDAALTTVATLVRALRWVVRPSYTSSSVPSLRTTRRKLSCGWPSCASVISTLMPLPASPVSRATTRYDTAGSSPAARSSATAAGASPSAPSWPTRTMYAEPPPLLKYA